jgi:hypothetical protein
MLFEKSPKSCCEIGEPFDFRGHVGQDLELDGGQWRRQGRVSALAAGRAMGLGLRMLVQHYV